MARTAAVFFDVDFTLIYPGTRFQGAGYQEYCARRGIAVDRTRFDAAVLGAAPVLAEARHDYDVDLYVRYTRRIIELMGGVASGRELDAVAREFYDEWAEHHHFALYDDVVGTLRALRTAGIGIGLISNSNRCLESFQSHFELNGLISVAVSPSVAGCMKPHPDIFRRALDLMQVAATNAAMVGDSLDHDVAGARGIGMRGVLVARGLPPAHVEDDVLVIRSLSELPGRLIAS
jgi:putative hydrolase of the HAD superfamily